MLNGRCPVVTGADLELHMDKDKYFVQCKQWKVMKVGVATVRELYGVMTAERAVGGFVVTSGSIPEDAEVFAEGRSMRLVEAGELRSMIGGSESAPANSSAKENDVDFSPACPKCGKSMVKRTAKTGSMAGRSFLGCSRKEYF